MQVKNKIPQQIDNESYQYEAFISYSHIRDSMIAAKLRSALHSFAKPWYKLRGVRVFVDRSGLAITPDLWLSITRSMQASSYFLLLASPEAANSTWVSKEVEYWLTIRPASSLYIIWTSGILKWDVRSSDFDWQRTDCLPVSLRGVFRAEPFYCDLRWVQSEHDLSLRNARFRESIAQISSTLRQLPLDVLIGEDIRQNRIVRRVTFTGVIALVLIAALAALGGTLAILSRKKAETAMRQSIARMLAAESRNLQQTQSDQLALSLLLALESLKREPSKEANELLREGLPLLRRTHFVQTHLHPVNVVAFAPDGKWFASAGGSLGGEGEVWVSNSKTGQQVLHLKRLNNVLTMSFSPDGKLLAMAGEDHLVTLWDISSNREFAHFDHDQDVMTVAFSPDGHILATGTGQEAVPGKLQLWDLQAKRAIAVLPHEYRVDHVVFSPDGQLLLAGGGRGLFSGAGEAKLWTVTGNRVFSISEDRVISALAFAPNGKFAAIASRNGRVRLWNTRTGDTIGEFDHGGEVTSIAFSPAGNTLATGGADGNLSLWDLSRKTRNAEITVGVIINAVTFSADGHLLATANGTLLEHGDIRVWDARSGIELARLSHRHAVTTVAFSPDGRLVASGAWDGRACVWDLESDWGPTDLKGGPGLQWAAFSSDNQRLATSTKDGTVRVWELHGGSVLQNFKQDTSVNTVAFSKDGRLLATGSGDDSGSGEMQIYDLAVGGELARIELSKRIVQLGFAPDSSLVAIGGHRNVGDFILEGGAGLWSLNGRRKLQWFSPSIVNSIAISPNGHFVASAVPYQGVQVWSVDNAKQLLQLNHEIGMDRGSNNANSVAFSPDNRFVATAGSDSTARLWDVTSGRELARIDHPHVVEMITFSKNGDLIASADANGTAIVWRTRDGKPIATLKHDRPLSAVAFSADGHFIATQSDEGAHLWDIAKQSELARIMVPSHLLVFSDDVRRVATILNDRVKLHRWIPEDLMQFACGHIPFNLTREQWRRFIPEEEYRLSCPNLPGP